MSPSGRPVPAILPLFGISRFAMWRSKRARSINASSPRRVAAALTLLLTVGDTGTCSHQAGPP